MSPAAGRRAAAGPGADRPVAARPHSWLGAGSRSLLTAAALSAGLVGCSSAPSDPPLPTSAPLTADVTDSSLPTDAPSTTSPTSARSTPASSTSPPRSSRSPSPAASVSSSSQGTPRPSPAETALVTVAGCLRGKGFAVGTAQTVDDRVQALSDLAQRTARQARSGGATIYFATTDSASGAALLRETLTVPNDPYRLRVVAKAVLMYRPSTPAAAVADARSCLRP